MHKRCITQPAFFTWFIYSSCKQAKKQCLVCKNCNLSLITVSHISKPFHSFKIHFISSLNQVQYFFMKIHFYVYYENSYEDKIIKNRYSLQVTCIEIHRHGVLLIRFPGLETLILTKTFSLLWLESTKWCEIAIIYCNI